MRIGLISDTHGLLRPQALTFLAGCKHIIHAGDVGAPGILEQLARIAPLTAVRGNNDRDDWAGTLAHTELVRFDRVAVYVIHDIAALDIDPVAAGVRVVVSGHSHVPKSNERDSVLYINPGSAGRRRFKLPISIAELTIDGTSVVPRIVHLHCS